MKQFLIAITLLLLPLLAINAQNPGGLSDEDLQTTGYAISLMDSGKQEEAIKVLDELLQRNPGNYLLQYERLYAMYNMKQYEKVAEESLALLDHKDGDVGIFQMCGNAFDIIGKTDRAREIYAKGIERYPSYGNLYLETGNLDLVRENYVGAIEWYNKGIDADPNFASNYYRAAQIYLMTERMKVWGLVYAETAVLRAPNNGERLREMAAGIRDCFVENIRTNAPADSVNVTLAQSRTMSIDSVSGIVYLGFPGVFEGCTSKSLVKMAVGATPFTGSISQLIDLRRDIVETYFNVTDNLYGNSMYLFPFWKSLIDAGHWEAYNYFLFGSACPEEFDDWYVKNGSKLEAFIDWYNNHGFVLGDGRTVGADSIFRDYRPVNMLEAIILQGKMITDVTPE